MPNRTGGVWKLAGVTRGGKMYCPFNDPNCRCGEHCITSIWSTPRNAMNHARHLERIVDKCAATRKAEVDEEE